MQIISNGDALVRHNRDAIQSINQIGRFHSLGEAPNYLKRSMKMISFRTFSVAISLLLLASSVMPLVAQRRGPRGRIWTKGEVNQLIKNAEDRSDSFIKLFDKALDKSALRRI